MSGRNRRTERDRRRRTLGQNFLADDRLVRRHVDALGIVPGDLVVDIGAGSGALTLPLARAGAEVWAIESDPVWRTRLESAVTTAGMRSSVRIIGADLRSLRLPRAPYRVVANPPFSLTTELLALLLDVPGRGPDRADLIVQYEVARKHTSRPPSALRTAAWAPWWEFDLGRRIDRASFRPRPDVDAAVLTIRRRSPPILPETLAADFAQALRPAWTRVHR